MDHRSQLEELRTLTELGGAAAPSHLVWSARARPDGTFGAGVRAWRYGSAVAVASPDASPGDRIAVTGDPARADDAVVLVREVLSEVGDGYRTFGEAELMAPAATAAGLTLGADFLWMETTASTGTPGGATRWLTEAETRSAVPLYDTHFPSSLAQPADPTGLRWAGIVDDGRPLSLAAAAWPARGCGLLGGVLTDPRARGRGLGRAVCAFVVDELVRSYGRAALMVDADNPGAIGVYERLGLRGRPFLAAFGPSATPPAPAA